MIVIAHRGASAYAPENTSAAFDLALTMEPDAVETDLRATRDGVLVLIHDEQVDRTTDGHGPVAEMSWDELQRLDAGRHKGAEFAGQRIPSFEYFLTTYLPKIPAYLEIKAEGVEAAAVEAVRQHGLTDRVVFTSFHFESVAKIAKFGGVRTEYLLIKWSETELERARAGGIAGFSLPVDILTPEIIGTIRGAGLGARGFGLRTDELMLKAVELGVDGVTIDFPDRLIRVLRERGLR